VDGGDVVPSMGNGLLNGLGEQAPFVNAGQPGPGSTVQAFSWACFSDHSRTGLVVVSACLIRSLQNGKKTRLIRQKRCI